MILRRGKGNRKLDSVRTASGSGRAFFSVDYQPQQEMDATSYRGNAFLVPQDGRARPATAGGSDIPFGARIGLLHDRVA